jgi:hypothetical protein
MSEAVGSIPSTTKKKEKEKVNIFKGDVERKCISGHTEIKNSTYRM